MKICHLAIPVLAWSQDDTSTLLSMKMQVHSTLEAGVDQLLESVGSRNVTEMSALVQNLVEETIFDSPYSIEKNVTAVEGEVKSALEMIKTILLGDIRASLKNSHCHDQGELHQRFLDFKKCEDSRDSGTATCNPGCDGLAHKKCRDTLLTNYASHMKSCRALDTFVADFARKDCPKSNKECCLLPESTWNCMSPPCETTIKKLTVDNSFGKWMREQAGIFDRAHKKWNLLHEECKLSYKEYVEQDAKCDCLQAGCETANCERENCGFTACEVVYQNCLHTANVNWEDTVKAKECLEKDRKIDWSATEKIECFVNVLTESPTKEDLLATCGKENCFNEYRQKMYHKCHDICPEVDFDAGSMQSHVRRDHKKGNWSGRNTSVKDQDTHQHKDQDVTKEGSKSVRTKHRAADRSDRQVRCTSHLDLDYQEKPCCRACEERPSVPCEGGAVPVFPFDVADPCGKGDKNSYMWIHYGVHDMCSKDTIDDAESQICHSGEHTKAYAFNLCQCTECAPNPYPAELQCGEGKPLEVCGSAGQPDSNNWDAHNMKVDCEKLYMVGTDE